MTHTAETTWTSRTGAFAELVAMHGRVLYAGTGFPQLFERVEATGEHHFDRSWLYLPAHYLQMIRDQATNGGTRTGVVWADPILCDDQPVLPLVYRGEVLAALSSHTITHPEFTASDLNLIQAWCEEVVADTADQVRQQSTTFIGELFQRDSSPQQFTKRALGLLTNGWSRSCAGMYAEYQGMYNLRIATGDVSRWFRLTRQIHPDMAMRCLEAMYRQEYFVPADTVGDYPSFLEVMPDFLFIHEGLLSPQCKQFLLVTGPGALSRRAALRLREYARLLSTLEEHQFASGAELLTDYCRLSQQGTHEESFDKMLSNQWAWISQQITLSRLAVVLRRDATDWGMATIVQRTLEGDSSVEEVNLVVPEQIIQSVAQGEGYAVSDIRAGELPDPVAKERYLHSVLSEYYLPLKSPEGVIGMVVFGAPTSGDHLEQDSVLLESIASYISLWLQIRKMERQGWSDVELSQMSSVLRADNVSFGRKSD